MSSDTAPLLLFAFNRPEKLSSLLGSLRTCPEFETSRVRIFIDGPRSPAEAQAVAQTRAVAEALVHPDKEIIARQANAGLKASILHGVTETLESAPAAIILEDDLVLSPHALTFFNDGLRHYADTDRVWSISGYMYDVPALRERRDAFFVPFPHPWGWATWADPWKTFTASQPNRDPAMLGSTTFRSYFDVLGLRDFASILELDRAGMVSSWYVNWYLEMFLHGGLSLAAPVSMVRNGGLTAGTHASGFSPHRLLNRERSVAERMPRMPERVMMDFAALDAIRNSADARLQRQISRLGRLKRLLKARRMTPMGERKA